MAALMMAAALAFSLTAFVQSRRISDAGLELRRVSPLAESLLSEPLTTLDETAGRTAHLDWRRTLQPVGEPGKIDICRRAVSIQGRGETPRAYTIAKLETCPPRTET